MNCKTQMEAGKKGMATEQMRIVAEKEQMRLETLMERVAAGSVVIPANINHASLSPEGIGEGLRTKINVNLGVSGDCADYEKEFEKVSLAIGLKAESIMDLSNYGKTFDFRGRLLEYSPAVVGTVPIYDCLGYLEKELARISADDFLETAERHAKQGVDFMTIHAGINRNTITKFKQSGRLTNIVSRGGSLLFAWMELTGHENPFYEYYDDLLDIFNEYDVTVSLGDALRPGSLADSTDCGQLTELIELSLLTKRAWARDVQVMIEGPGHMAMNEIEANVKLQKRLCHNAPFYVLGPLVTDMAPGYDHITSAIGGAIAGGCGADFLCCVTPSEHLRLPDLADIKDGIIAGKISAHAADIAKGIPNARDIDNKMSDARRRVDWEEMYSYAIDPQKAREYRESIAVGDERTCSMCGKMCAVRTANAILAGEKLGL